MSPVDPNPCVWNSHYGQCSCQPTTETWQCYKTLLQEIISRGPRTEPWGTPRALNTLLVQPLKEDGVVTLRWCLWMSSVWIGGLGGYFISQTYHTPHDVTSRSKPVCLDLTLWNVQLLTDYRNMAMLENAVAGNNLIRALKRSDRHVPKDARFVSAFDPSGQQTQ